MWFKILSFELKYRSKRPATYIFFGLLFLIGFLTMSTDVISIGGGSGLVKENAPITIARMMVILSGFMMMITSAIMGVAVLRDFEHNTHSMVFTTPISKFDYLAGRFSGSFIVTLLVFSGILLGFVAGEFMPWRDPDRLLPFNFWNYLQPFLLFIIPNIFFTSVLFFFTGALSRKMVTVYVQWIALFAIYQVALILTRQIDNRSIAALLDPIALSTINNTIQYWTVAEQNTLNIAFDGMVFWNRILWIGIGLITMIIGYLLFDFNVVKSKRLKKKTPEVKSTSNHAVPIPKPTLHFGPKTYLLQIRKQSWFYFNYVVKGIPFLAIAGFGFILMIVNSFSVGQVFGTSTYPTTYLMLELITGDFTIFFVIIMVFYSGELVWRERDVRIHLIQDTLPMPDFVGLLSKFLGLIMVFVVVLLFLIMSGVLVQASMGFYKFDLSIYFTTLFSETLSLLILFSVMAFFIQVIVNNKFLGHALMIIFFIVMGVLDELGLQHNLFQFGGGTLGTYSEMNGYGHFVTSFSWFDLYWFSFVAFLFVIAVIFSVRGTEASMKWRWRVGKLRFARPLIVVTICSLMVFGLSGFYIYYNTNVLNTFRSTNEIAALQADYEKALKKYQLTIQPKIIDTKLEMEIYPETRDYSVKGTYMLKNFETEPISDIHIQLGQDDDTRFKEVKFDKPSTITESYEQFRYFVHRLHQPLAPGDSIQLNFELEYVTSGFKEDATNTSIVYNGTFLNNMEFPSLGYNEALELLSDNRRKNHGLEPKSRLMTRDNPVGLGINFVSDDSHGTGFEIILGTTKDQIAVAPGNLEREWEENGRKYFHYRMDQKMIPFFGIVSARYQVMKDKVTIDIDSGTREVDLEIYYHQGHEYNLETMMEAMKNSLTYYSRNFGPYQFDQMRILEYPRYATNAQSFANTVPFSEGIGFMVKMDDESDVNVPYFVTAHEMAHQWWGHQLHGANVQGSAIFSETLSQYSALMVMKQVYPAEQIREYLRQELNRYLTGRTTEQKKEMPLALVENQQYIHYGKGANVMYALQDYIGEDSVNIALKRLLKDWKLFETRKRYVTSKEFLDYLYEVTPDSLQNVITDFFDKIILYENRTEEANYKQVSEDEYWVSLKLNTRKIEADSLGQTTTVRMNDWVDVGIYSQDEQGKEQLIYLKKHLLNHEVTELRIRVTQKPSTAGVDPLNKLIDRNPSDNVISVEKNE